MSRIAITLDEHARAELAKRAEAAQEPVSKTAARLVRDGLLSTQAPSRAQRPAAAAGARAGGASGVSPPDWVQPPDEGKAWRRRLWASVCALHERYPRVFGKLIADWWSDNALIETLGALSVWRAQLDSGDVADPRAELLFQDRLELLERRLAQTGDPTATRFTGGSPPSEWVA